MPEDRNIFSGKKNKKHMVSLFWCLTSRIWHSADEKDMDPFQPSHPKNSPFANDWTFVNVVVITNSY